MSLFPGAFYGINKDKPVKDTKWCDQQSIIYELENYWSAEKFQEAEETLKFPHKWLMLIFSKLLLHSRKLISQETRKSYNNSLSLYKKMTQTNNVEKWIECIKQIEDKEAAKLLDAYYEYTNLYLFISDKKAVVSYRNEIERFSILNQMKTAYWVDTIKYEIKYGDLKTAYQLLKKAVAAVLKKEIAFIVKDKNNFLMNLQHYSKEMERSERLNITSTKDFQTTYGKSTSASSFSNRLEYAFYGPPPPKKIPCIIKFKNNPVKQNFPFRHSFIQHFLKSANGYILRKIFGTCKFFFSYLQTPLCYRLEVCENNCFGTNNKIVEEALLVQPYEDNASDLSILNNLHVYGKLYCFIALNRRCLSAALQKVYRCDVNRLCVTSQDLTLKEFKFFVNKFIVQICFVDVFVYNDGQPVDAIILLRMTKQMPYFKFFEHLNDKWFMCFTAAAGYKLLPLFKQQLDGKHFENIYIERQELPLSKLNQLLNPTSLKQVFLINTTIKNSHNKIMKKNEIKELIQSKVQKRMSIIVIEKNLGLHF